MADEITLKELAEFMTRQLPKTYDVFDKNRAEDSDYNTASRARGRIDAYLEPIALIDAGREAMLRAEWERVVSGDGFMRDEE